MTGVLTEGLALQVRSDEAHARPSPGGYGIISDQTRANKSVDPSQSKVWADSGLTWG